MILFNTAKMKIHKKLWYVNLYNYHNHNKIRPSSEINSFSQSINSNNIQESQKNEKDL